MRDDNDFRVCIPLSLLKAQSFEKTAYLYIKLFSEKGFKIEISPVERESDRLVGILKFDLKHRLYVKKIVANLISHKKDLDDYEMIVYRQKGKIYLEGKLMNL